MIDLGQYRTAQDIRDCQPLHHPWPTQSERELRNRAIETDSESDWLAWRAVRDARITNA